MHIARMAAAALSILLALTTVEARGQGEAPLFSLDFADYQPADGSVRDWLAGRGFDFAKAADDDRKISVSVEDGALWTRGGYSHLFENDFASVAADFAFQSESFCVLGFNWFASSCHYTFD